MKDILYILKYQLMSLLYIIIQIFNIILYMICLLIQCPHACEGMLSPVTEDNFLIGGGWDDELINYDYLNISEIINQNKDPSILTEVLPTEIEVEFKDNGLKYESQSERDEFNGFITSDYNYDDYDPFKDLNPLEVNTKLLDMNKDAFNQNSGLAYQSFELSDRTVVFVGSENALFSDGMGL